MDLELWILMVGEAFFFLLEGENYFYLFYYFRIYGNDDGIEKKALIDDAGSMIPCSSPYEILVHITLKWLNASINFSSVWLSKNFKIFFVCFAIISTFNKLYSKISPFFCSVIVVDLEKGPLAAD